MTLYQNFGNVPFELEAEKRNENTKIVAETNVARWHAQIERLKQSGIPTMRDLGGDQRLLHYTQMTDPNDFPLLLVDDYLDKARQNLLPALRSPRWRAMAAIPDLFEEVRRDFVNLYKQKVTNAKREGQTPPGQATRQASDTANGLRDHGATPPPQARLAR